MEALSEIRGELWSVLCMTVNPGWGGQEFIPASLDKIRRLRALVGPDVELEVDGGIDERHRRARAPRRARRSSWPEPPCSGPWIPGQPSAEVAAAAGCS